MLIYIRLAEKQDLDQIMEIIAEAKKLLKEDGNPQWQNGSPNRKMLAEDIALKRTYCLVANKEIAGVAVLLTTPDPNYTEIDGAWKNNDEQYATIHRIAISTEFRGQHLSQFMMSNLISRGLMLGIHNFAGSNPANPIVLTNTQPEKRQFCNRSCFFFCRKIIPKIFLLFWYFTI